MKKIIFLTILTVYLISCSSSTNINGSLTVNGTTGNHNLVRSRILIVKQRKKIEHYAKFNYYANFTPLASELEQVLSGKGYKVKSAPLTIFSSDTQDNIRAIAARFDADKVIILKENYHIDAGVNILSLAYLTIIGMYFFPGNYMISTCNVDASVIDVESGKQIMDFTSAARSHRYVYRIGNSQNVLNSSISEARNKVLEQIVGKITGEARG